MHIIIIFTKNNMIHVMAPSKLFMHTRLHRFVRMLAFINWNENEKPRQSKRTMMRCASQRYDMSFLYVVYIWKTSTCLKGITMNPFMHRQVCVALYILHIYIIHRIIISWYNSIYWYLANARCRRSVTQTEIRMFVSGSTTCSCDVAG